MVFEAIHALLFAKPNAQRPHLILPDDLTSPLNIPQFGRYPQVSVIPPPQQIFIGAQDLLNRTTINLQLLFVYVQCPRARQRILWIVLF